MAWSIVYRDYVADVNPIDAARRIDWSLAGVEGGITHRTGTPYQSLTSSATAAQINTAISDCSSAGGGIVALGAGTYSLSTKIVMKSNVTLRGAGMSTILRFTGTGDGDGLFFFGQSNVAVYFGGTYDSSGYNTAPFGVQVGGFPSSKIKSWTGCGGASGSYPSGATVLNLSAAPTGLAAGDMVCLYQSDEDPADTEPNGTPLSGSGTDAAPRNGLWVTSKRTTSPRDDGTVWEGAAGGTVSLQQRARVVSISGNDVTIWPGVLASTGLFKSGLSPKIAWQGGDIRLAGIEDCRIDVNTSGPNNQWGTVQFWQAANCWITRCLIQPRTGQAAGSNTYGAVHMFESRNCTVRSNWIGPLAGGAQGTTTSYGTPNLCTTLNLIENNVLQAVESPMLNKACSFGMVSAYNYEIENGSYEGGYQYHESGIIYQLGEGNITLKVWGDLFHGATPMNTLNRMYVFGTNSINLEAYHRYNNVVGCVINSATRYSTDCDDGTLYTRWDDFAFRLGMPNQQNNLDPFYNPGNGGITKDSQVEATLFRWGNYTANDTTTRFLTSECPTADAYFPNPVPSTQTLPSSMYLSARPSWFTFNGTTVAWPPIGSDVTGGVLHGGRVHKIPAQLAYENAGGVGTSFNPSLYG